MRYLFCESFLINIPFSSNVFFSAPIRKVEKYPSAYIRAVLFVCVCLIAHHPGGYTLRYFFNTSRSKIIEKFLKSDGKIKAVRRFFGMRDDGGMEVIFVFLFSVTVSSLLYGGIVKEK